MVEMNYTKEKAIIEAAKWIVSGWEECQILLIYVSRINYLMYGYIGILSLQLRR